jgi:hypothetical protein
LAFTLLFNLRFLCALHAMKGGSMRAKKTQAKKFLAPVFGLCLMTTLVSCGSDDDNSSTNIIQSEQQQGTFQAQLAAANPKLGLTLTNAVATVSHLGDNFDVEITMNGAPVTAHLQHIHSGSRCATMADDKNGDGYIDAIEGEAVSGAPLLPLDDDISNTSEDTYPSTYPYHESTSFALLTGQPGPTPTPTATPTSTPTPTPTASGSPIPGPSASPLNVNVLSLADSLLEGRVVEIHGVPASANLPNTVLPNPGSTPEKSIPIACGVLVRVPDGSTATTRTISTPALPNP